MTERDLEADKRLCEAAIGSLRGAELEMLRREQDGLEDFCSHNAKDIDLVCEALPYWLAEVERLRAENAALQERLQWYVACHAEACELVGEAAPPVPTHSRYYSRDPKRLDAGVLPWVSMAEALGWGRTARPSVTVTGGGTETGGAEPLAKLAREVAAADWVVRLDPSLPATTVQGDPRLTAREHHYHGEQNSTSTRVTVAEAAALQSYPPGFTFAGTKTKQFLQVGNAVPPLLAEAILRAVIS